MEGAKGGATARAGSRRHGDSTRAAAGTRARIRRRPLAAGLPPPPSTPGPAWFLTLTVPLAVSRRRACSQLAVAPTSIELNHRFVVPAPAAAARDLSQTTHESRLR
ncbi:hypothetical protein BS78_01G079100 [Paspalum vaginatum]|nr:hypothetical protein BS78_01G079100 [Paspalum vaginatum]